MLKYPCLVLDHDDTVVQSEKSLGYPYFCQVLAAFRPGVSLTLEEYVLGCHNLGFVDMCRDKWQFTDRELEEEYLGWKDYMRSHIPDPYDGIREILHRQRAEGGRIFVVSHSSIENITRDYRAHFGLQPDGIYGWDLPEHQRKPNPYPLLDIMERYGYAPSELLVVDDLKLAYTMARGAGVPIGFAAWSKEDLPRLKEEMTRLCDFTFQTPGELYRFLFE